MRYKVYYARYARTKCDLELVPSKLAQTHILIGEIETASLNDLYRRLQIETMRFNPFVILSKGVDHISLSIGDVVQVGDEFYECAYIGWRKIGDNEATYWEDTPANTNKAEWSLMSLRWVLKGEKDWGG